MEFLTAESSPPLQDRPAIASSQELLTVVAANPQDSKHAIRRSLRASTLDGVFATIFSNIAGGVLLSNFLVDLDATAIEVGMLSSIPMLANLIQPLGAYLSNRTHSRHWYCLWVYGPSRLLWLLLVGAIAIAYWRGNLDNHHLVLWTLGVVFLSHTLGALGSASWLSWLAVLVPRRLRGRYFGIRNSASSLTNLLSVPLLGVMVSTYPGGSIQGYGVILILGVVMGLISLGFQYLMIDVNPQVEQITPSKPQQPQAIAIPSPDPNVVEPAVPLVSPVSPPNLFKDANFLIFLAYFGVWMFAVNLSAPFFNLYLLDDLSLDVRWVTIYNSLSAGANLVALVIWGKIADRLGNRTILLTVGIVVAITPILWLGTGADSLSLWLWFPLLHMLGGSTWAAIDLCTNNMQLGVAPVQSRATCFAIAAAVAGVTGALGATAGGVLTQLGDYGGLPGMFALSTVVRLVALLPLVFVQEKRGRSLRQMMRVLFPDRSPSLSHQIQAGSPLDPLLDPSVEFIEASSLLDLEPPDLPLQD